MNQFLSACFLVLTCFQGMMLQAQKKWKGSVDNKWSTAANWEPAGIPGGTDDVVLDNVFLTENYNVILPDEPVSIHTLIIEPAPGKQVELTLPVSNLSSPAFHALGTGNVIILRSGSIFRNSSGINNGQSILLNGSIRIEDGGKYIHNTRSSHAAELVAKLASGAGTEKGVFEFDVPGGAYPVSLSNRTFGKLVFSAFASGGSQTYNASGSNTLTIRDDFQMNNGVQLNIDFLGDFIVQNDFIQKGGVFNIASQPNNNVIHLKGNIEQAAGAVITETSSGMPVLELNGTLTQSALMEGEITNDITVRLNNPQGLELLHGLQLPFHLELTNGIIVTTQQNLLSLSERSKINGSSALSYVDGPLKKRGDDDFEFPLGKQGSYAPVTVHGGQEGIMQEITVEYFNGDPSKLFGETKGKDITNLSAQEYWTITRSSAALPWKITLPVHNYSNATGNAHPVIAWWDNLSAIWTSKGNTVQPGASEGLITSNELTSSGTFTLAGNVVNMQPLAMYQLDFYAERQLNSIVFTWIIDKNAGATSFILESSNDGTNFDYLVTIGANVNSTVDGVFYNYSMIKGQRGLKQYYKVRAILADGSEMQSDIVLVPGTKEMTGLTILTPTVVHNNATFTIQSMKGEMLHLTVTDMYGRVVKNLQRVLNPGSNSINLDLSDLPIGIYQLQQNSKLKPGNVARFIKQ
jgi:hypothetical protein